MYSRADLSGTRRPKLMHHKAQFGPPAIFRDYSINTCLSCFVFCDAKLLCKYTYTHSYLYIHIFPKLSNYFSNSEQAGRVTLCTGSQIREQEIPAPFWIGV